MNDSVYTRRRLLQLTGGAAAVGLAGCTDGQTGDEQTESTTTSTSTGTETHSDETEHGHDGDETSHMGEDSHKDGGHSDEDSHGGEHDHGSVGEPTETADVTASTTDGGEYHFDPHVTRVKNGGTVTWVLESGSHTATAYHPDNNQPQLMPDGADAWDSGMLSESGETFEHTFETEGVYHYYCAPHESTGMIGTVIVGEPDPHNQPALEDPPEEKPKRVRDKLTELNTMVNKALGHEH